MADSPIDVIADSADRCLAVADSLVADYAEIEKTLREIVAELKGRTNEW